MAAKPLPNANLDRYGRDPESPTERLRKRTSYDKQTGYGPYFAAMHADLGRLSSGVACHNLILAILVESLGRPHDKGTPAPRQTLFRKAEEWAQLAYCSGRGFERVRDYLKERKMVLVTTNTRRETAFELTIETWQALEDYSVWLKAHPGAVDVEQQDEDQVDADFRKPNRGDVYITPPKKPTRVKPNSTSREYPITCGVKSIQVANASGIDLEAALVVRNGRVEAVISEVIRKAKKAPNSKQNAKPEKSTSSEYQVRHPRRDAFALSSPKAVNSDSPASKALCKLFDPILQNFGTKLLSADESALRKSVDALGDLPVSIVGQFFEATKRAARSPFGPAAIPGIIEEIRANQKASFGGQAREIDKLCRILGIREFSVSTFSTEYYIEKCEQSLSLDLTADQRKAADRLLELLQK